MIRTKLDWVINATTGEDIDKAIAENLDVISAISCEMAFDKENESAKLLSLYEEADPGERAIMDAMLVSICGWTMSSIIEKASPMEA